MISNRDNHAIEDQNKGNNFCSVLVKKIAEKIKDIN